ncbi:MAG: MerR family transcriptional regulator [Proteobacteria bacterium]|nr:MAG: MerR family transcriptional regulator [Pseudomonadota bacterium]
MNNIKSVFSIKDLENLSGIKAHTIRIWEKRYNILKPMRTDTNIRYYDSYNLQKLLNVVLLHRHGYKISKIGTYPDEKIPQLLREIISDKSAKHHAITSFKIAMLNFDQSLFLQTYDKLLSQKSFREIFKEVFLPLLDEIGFLWQTGTITPAHEHFISYLVRQKIYIQTENLQVAPPENTDRVYVLFLPQYELHELGLLYVNYEIALAGMKSIYLGESVPISGLRDVKHLFKNVTYVTYLTVEPQADEVDQYVSDFFKEIMDDDSQFWILGQRGKLVTPRTGVKLFQSIDALVDHL